MTPPSSTTTPSSLDLEDPCAGDDPHTGLAQTAERRRGGERVDELARGGDAVADERDGSAAAGESSATPAPLRWPSSSSTTIGPSGTLGSPEHRRRRQRGGIALVRLGARRDEHALGLEPGNAVGVGVDTGLDAHAEPLELGRAPLDEPAGERPAAEGGR